MNVVIEGTDLPGLRCLGHTNVHVGLCSRSAKHRGMVVAPSRPWSVVELVPGDAPGARWEFDITLKENEEGVDFGGPFVRGNSGDRHVGLGWGDVEDGTFHLFRGAKLRLDQVDAATLHDAAEADRCLVGRVGLTDTKGNPRCASVRPPTIVWSAEARHLTPSAV